jgi:hypothetical protein
MALYSCIYYNYHAFNTRAVIEAGELKRGLDRAQKIPGIALLTVAPVARPEETCANQLSLHF